MTEKVSDERDATEAAVAVPIALDSDALLLRLRSAEERLRQSEAGLLSLEEELANVSKLFVASDMLNSTLRLPMVVRHVRELLLQIIGASAFTLYLLDEETESLVTVFSEAVPKSLLVPIRVDARTLEDPALATRIGLEADVQRVFQSGDSQIVEGPLLPPVKGQLPACLPLRLDDRVVGVVAVHAVLAQKTEFAWVDFELFKLLCNHGAGALVSGMLCAAQKGKLPTPDVILDLDPRSYK